MAVYGHEGDFADAQEGGLREVSPGEFVREAAKNDFLVSWSHGGGGERVRDATIIVQNISQLPKKGVELDVVSLGYNSVND